MKKILFAIPFMAISLLMSCGNNDQPEPGPTPEKTYTVEWKNYDGTVLDTDENVKDGTIPSYGGPYPTRPSEYPYKFDFSGWSPSISEVHDNQTYIAQYDKKLLHENPVYLHVNTTNAYKTITFEYTYASTGDITVDFGEGATYKNRTSYTYTTEGSHDINIYGDITSINITVGEKIVDEAFFGKGITTIGEYAFLQFTKLTSVYLPDTVTEIKDRAFMGCTQLKTINLPNNLTKIGDHSFSSCPSLQSVVLPEKLSSLGVFNFSGCTSLKNIYIPKNITSIGVGAFTGNNLESIEVSPENNFYESGDGCNAIITKTDTADFKKDTLICGCKNTIIPSNVKTLGTDCFNYCKNLSSIDIPNNVINIGSNAFSGCEKLSEIILPNNLYKIDFGAFTYCSSLQSVTIPSSVQVIEGGLFDNCPSLSQINVSENNEYYTDGDANAIISKKDITDEEGYPLWNKNTLIEGIATTIIPNTVTTIGIGSFAHRDLVSIKIPNSVTLIEQASFWKNENLTIVDLTEYSDGATIPTLEYSNIFSGCSDSLLFYVASDQMKSAFSVAPNWSTYASQFTTDPLPQA